MPIARSRLHGRPGAKIGCARAAGFRAKQRPRSATATLTALTAATCGVLTEFVSLRPEVPGAEVRNVAAFEVPVNLRIRPLVSFKRPPGSRQTLHSVRRRSHSLIKRKRHAPADRLRNDRDLTYEFVELIRIK